MKRSLTLIAVCCLGLVPLATAADKDSPYLVDERDFRKQYKVIALAPVDADPVLEMPGSVAAMIEEEVTKRLEKRGFTVLPTSVLAAIRKMMEAQVGGFTDAETGQTDPAKVAAVREHAFRELWFREKFDALALMRVYVTRADVESDRAEWHRVKQKVERSGKNTKYTAKVAASSVAFMVFDHTGKLLFVHDGGLELLMRRVDMQFEPLPAEQYFSDEKRVRKAAQLSVSEI